MDSRQVFISYSRNDDKGVSTAYELRERINETTNLLAFLDEYSLSKGKRWDLGLDKGLEDSFVVVVIIGGEANKSTWVTYEWAYAMGLDKPIIALKVEANPESPIHDKLEKYQNYKDRFISPNEEDWQELLVDLQKLYADKQIPTMIERAIEFAEHPLSEYREQAIESLKQNEHPKSTEALVDLLESYLPDTRQQSAFALAHKTKDERTIPELKEAFIQITNHKKAADLLRHIDTPNSAKALYELYISVEKRHSYTRKIIIQKLCNFENQKAIPCIRKCYRHKSDKLPVERFELLRKLAENNDSEAISDFKDFVLRDYNIQNLENIKLTLVRDWTRNYRVKYIIEFYIDVAVHHTGKSKLIRDAALERLTALEQFQIIQALNNLINEINRRPYIDGSYIDSEIARIKQSIE